jgi:hypothetical protein
VAAIAVAVFLLGEHDTLLVTDDDLGGVGEQLRPPQPP